MELSGGYTASEILNNPVVKNVTLPDGVIIKIIQPFTLMCDAVYVTSVPNVKETHNPYLQLVATSPQANRPLIFAMINFLKRSDIWNNNLPGKN